MRCSQRTLGMRPRKDHRDVDLISDAFPLGRLWYGGPNAISNAVGYAEFRSRRKNPRRGYAEKMMGQRIAQGSIQLLRDSERSSGLVSVTLRNDSAS